MLLFSSRQLDEPRNKELGLCAGTAGISSIRSKPICKRKPVDRMSNIFLITT